MSQESSLGAFDWNNKVLKVPQFRTVRTNLAGALASSTTLATIHSVSKDEACLLEID
jgi:hypothetical protein